MTWAARHPILAFTILAYAISWTCWLPLLADRQDWVSWSRRRTGISLTASARPSRQSSSPRRSPAVAALPRFSGAQFAWDGRLGWLSLAIFGPLALFAVAVIAARVVDGTWPDLSRFGVSAEYPALCLAVSWAANLLFYGYREEIGWLGFVQPHIHIVVVAVFHAAFDIATTTPTTTTLIPTLTGAAITVVGLAVIPSLAKARRTDAPGSLQQSREFC